MEPDVVAGEVAEQVAEVEWVSGAGEQLLVEQVPEGQEGVEAAAVSTLEIFRFLLKDLFHRSDMIWHCNRDHSNPPIATVIDGIITHLSRYEGAADKKFAHERVLKSKVREPHAILLWV